MAAGGKTKAAASALRNLYKKVKKGTTEMNMDSMSSLIDMANGAIKERLDYEMGRVIQNIGDPNTKAAAKRTITVKITLEPDEERQHIEVSATASSTLAPMHPVKTSLAVGNEDGHIVAVELTPQIPGQLNTDGSEAPQRKVLKFDEIYTA